MMKNLVFCLILAIGSACENESNSKDRKSREEISKEFNVALENAEDETIGYQSKLEYTWEKVDGQYKSLSIDLGESSEGTHISLVRNEIRMNDAYIGELSFILEKFKKDKERIQNYDQTIVKTEALRSYVAMMKNATEEFELPFSDMNVLSFFEEDFENITFTLKSARKLRNRNCKFKQHTRLSGYELLEGRELEKKEFEVRAISLGAVQDFTIHTKGSRFSIHCSYKNMGIEFKKKGITFQKIINLIDNFVEVEGIEQKDRAIKNQYVYVGRLNKLL